MATCGTCHREITWTTGPDGKPLALDKLPSFDGPDRFTLQFPEGGGRPNAIPITVDRYFSGYKRHELSCGQGHRS